TRPRCEDAQTCDQFTSFHPPLPCPRFRFIVNGMTAAKWVVVDTHGRLCACHFPCLDGDAARQARRRRGRSVYNHFDCYSIAQRRWMMRHFLRISLLAMGLNLLGSSLPTIAQENRPAQSPTASAQAMLPLCQAGVNSTTSDPGGERCMGILS